MSKSEKRKTELFKICAWRKKMRKEKDGDSVWDVQAKQIGNSMRNENIAYSETKDSQT